MSNDDRVLNARWIIPISSEPIHGGWIRTNGYRIVEIGRGRIPSAENLGDVAILPQLVNSHTHLEFSDCHCPIGKPGMPLARWIGEVVSTRANAAESSRDRAIESGLEELKLAGTCLAAEIATPPSNNDSSHKSRRYPESSAGHMSLVTFAEVLGLSDERADERFEAAMQHCSAYQSAGISPHAPYSTSWKTIGRSVDFLRDSVRPLAMHVAESPDERELLFSGSGPFVSALKSIGAWRDGLFPWPDDGFEGLIERLSMAPRALLIHGNDLNEREMEQLSKYPHMTPVYCPRTHAYFDYAPHPVDRMLSLGIRVALGTDSRASNPDLHLWREVQHLLNKRQDLAPHEVLRMATQNGALALGRSDLGHLSVGAQSHLGFIRTTATDLDGLFEDCSNASFHALPHQTG